MNLTELNEVQPDQLIVGHEYLVTNLGGDGDYTENLSPRKFYRGTVRECCPHNARISEDKYIFPNIGLSQLTELNQSNSVLKFKYLKGWNIHNQAWAPKFYII